ncbi:hypothetical protein KJ359_003748 [Pestalotiopsis sp. 9143b]|nr:hypothetical protein KJ359_003748 [Pestalotiopsis sp. 9143b]
MAQGGHSWPGGQFHPNGMEHNGAIDPNTGSLAYGNDTEMLYMDDWSAMNQTPANFVGQTHNAPAGQQFYHAPQSYYQSAAAFSDGSRQIEQRTSSPAVTYGNSMYHDPAYQRPAPQQPEQQQQHAPPQQQTYQPYSAPDMGQRNVAAPAGNFTEASWQSQGNHGAQNQYAQQPLAYDHQQSMYQQHLRQPSHAHTPTPPPAQRSTAQYAVSHGGPVNSRPNAATPPASNIQGHVPPQSVHQGTSEYHYQANQGQPSQVPYQNTPMQSGPMASAYANQVRFAQQPQSNGHANVGAVSQQPVGQQQVFAVQPPATAQKMPVARTTSPMASGQYTAPAPGPYAANSPAPPVQPHAPSVPQQPVHTPATFMVIQTQPPFDPVSHGGFSQLAGDPNLFLSDAPTEIEWTDFVPDDSFSFSAHFNAKDGPLIPSRQKRLPCEIRRDWKWLRKQEKSAQNDPQRRRAILLEKDRVDREMVDVSGERIEPTTKIGMKKLLPKSGNKPTSARKTESDSSDDSTAYESDSDFEESEEDQAARKIKASGKPSDPVKAIEYDVVLAVWRAPEEAVQPNATANAIQAFGAHIEKLWTRIKDLKKDAKAAKEKKSKKLESLEAETGTQLKLMRTAIEAVTRFAETSVLENMGGNSKLAVILWNSLRSCLITKDFNGPLPKAILNLMSHFTTMERSLVSGVLKVPEYQKKHQKDFDKTCLAYLDQIQIKAKGATAEAEKKAKDSSTSEAREALSAAKKTPVVMARDLVSASKKAASSEPKKTQATGSSILDARKATGSVMKSITGSPSKRPRDEDVDSRAAKKVAVDGASSTSVIKPGTATTKTTTVVQPRPKAGGSLLPGRTARPAVKPAPKKAEPQQSSSLSTISGLLAEIAKPKSPPRQKEEPTKAPETEEERKRRLRKEARRGLRVMWKPDHELEQVRVFQHDAAEDEGRASNMVRDARDNRSEGQALKRARVNSTEEQDGDAEKEDDEDEVSEDQPKETSLRPWSGPPEVEFTHIDQVNPGQRGKIFVTCGGTATFHTEEQQAMAKYEQTQLMEIYTSVSDIPETPKSPTRKEAEKPSVTPHTSQLPADTPNLQEMHLRWTEIAQLGPEQATQRALQRLRNRSDPDGAAKFDRLLADLQNASMMSQDRHQPYAFAPSASQQVQPSKKVTSVFMTPAERDAEVLRLLKSDAVLKYVDAHPVDHNNMTTAHRHDYGDEKVQMDIDSVEAAAATFLGKPYPATEPPEHMESNAAYIKEWQTGYNKSVAEKTTNDATERAKKLAEEFARGNAASAVQAAAAPATTQSAQEAWAAYFAQMAAGQNQAQPAQGQQLTYDQYAVILQQTQALQAQQSGPGTQAPAAQYPQQPQPAQQDQNGHIGALLAALGGQNSQAQSATTTQSAQQDPAAAAWAMQQDPNAAAWAAYYAAMGQTQQSQAAAPQQQHQPQQNSYQHRDRDRSNRNYNGADAMLDYGPSESDTRDKAHRGRKDNNNNNKEAFRSKDHGAKDYGVKDYGKDYDRKGINRSLIGTKPCTFWAQGKCAKGDQCTFRHDPNDLK